MSSPNEYSAEILMFLQLDMPLQQLREIFVGVEGFSILLGERRPREFAPGIIIGPPSVAIAQYKNTRIEYIGERFIVRQIGPVSELIELNEKLPSLFERNKYSINELLRFCELNSNGFIIGNGIVDWIRSKVKVDIESLSKVCNEDIKPFSLWVTNSDTPLTDNWFNIMLEPDVNSPHHKLFWRITKRTKTHGELTEFLKKVKSIIEELSHMFGV